MRHDIVLAEVQGWFCYMKKTDRTPTRTPNPETQNGLEPPAALCFLQRREAQAAFLFPGILLQMELIPQMEVTIE